MSETIRLTPEPTVDATAILADARLGAYTEVGAQSMLEHVEMGDYSYCGHLCIFQNVSIGAFANIAALVRIGPTAHPNDRPTQHHMTYRRARYGFGEDDDAFFAWRREQRTTIGHDTWIGHGAIIMPGVAVGTGAIVGAGAVVTRDVAPWTVAVGVPARAVKRRFPEATAAALERIAWWRWDHATLRERIDELGGDVEAFIAAYDPDRADGGLR